MTSPNPMTREELLESAALDAFGLIEEYESDLYTRSFHHAPAAVQNEILQLQADLVSDEALMISEMPPPELRHRVLEAVADAVQQETVELAPLATIGRGGAPRAAVHPSNPFAFGSSTPYWRAAAFMLCASLIVVGYFWKSAVDQGNRVAVLSLSNLTDRELEKLIGPTVKDFMFNPAAKAVHLAGTAGNGSMRGVIYTLEGANQGDGQAFLVFEGVPANAESAPYHLTLQDSNGNKALDHEFNSLGSLSGGVRFAINTTALSLKNAKWTITNATGTVVLMANV